MLQDKEIRSTLPKRQSNVEDKAIFFVGMALIVIGLVFNEWLVRSYLSPDGILQLDTLKKIRLFESFCILSGLMLGVWGTCSRVRKAFGVEKALQLFALLLMISTFIKSVVDIDVHYDSWAYHLTLAARLWGIVSPESYNFGNYIDSLIAGYPLVVEWLQGFFWWLFQRPEAANLVGFLSLVAYLCFLKSYCRIPLYLSTLTLMAVPLIHIHATSCYVDLPGNIFASILIIMTFLIFSGNESFSLKNLSIIVVSAFIALNTKFLLFPIIAVMTFALCVFYAFSIYKNGHLEKRKKVIHLLSMSLGLCLLLSVIFFTPLKNTIQHGNPFYPVRFQIGQIVLNHTYRTAHTAPSYLKDAPEFQVWMHSILELRNEWFDWSIDQWAPDRSNHNRMGGYFGFYVIFNLFILGYMVYRIRHRIAWIAGGFMVFLTIMTGPLPEAHELRYYMYWMIALLSLNLYLISRFQGTSYLPGIIKNKSFGVVSCAALMVVIIATMGEYIWPNRYGFSDLVASHVDKGSLTQIHEDEAVCVVGNPAYRFLYAPAFHPSQKYAVKKLARSELQCGGYTVLKVKES